MTLSKPIIFETAFANFTANDILGEGGAGRVYKANNESGSEFAVKMLDPMKATKERLRRFQNELLFSLKNQHPNIITVVDYGVFRDGKKTSPFYVMPLYAGSLRKLLLSRIPPDKVLVYFSQLLDGMEAAHLFRVVHRDLKPENVLYDEAKNRLLIADFGIARFEEEDLYTAVETAPSTRLANFQYAAPEQRSRGFTVDSRADIYAIGLILNEMFTGAIPQGTGYKTIGSVSPECGYLDDLVSTMLRQSADERPASIEIVKQQLIARKNEFVTRQRINELKQTVISVTDIDDPLILDPPRLVNFDYDSNMLTLIFQHSVNQKWISALYNMDGYSSYLGKEPTRFSISGDKACINASEHEVQQIIDSFKSWLPTANRKYEEMIRKEKIETEEEHRRQLQREVEEQERRQRVLKNVKL